MIIEIDGTYHIDGKNGTNGLMMCMVINCGMFGINGLSWEWH